MKEKTVYSQREDEEFSKAKIETPTLPKDYRYRRDRPLEKVLRFFLYDVIAKPFGFLYLKTKFHWKVVGKEKLKESKDSPLFLYGNHTQEIGDAFLPALFFHRKIRIIVHPNNLKSKGVGWAVPYLGGYPLPQNISNYRSFFQAMKKSVEKKEPIVIYPEAHIWPYCTFIRPFKKDSFHYPVSFHTPVYCFTNTYQKRKNPNKVKIVTYIDGPFYPREGEDEKESFEKQVREAMNKRASLSTKELIHYVKKP